MTRSLAAMFARAAMFALAGLAACDHSMSTPAKLLLVTAPGEGEVAPWIGQQRAAAPGRDVLVYVGASWCEPCQHFHDAAAAGELDAAFPRLTLLEFDSDRDEARLRAAGYSSTLIPLFARADVDGRAAGPSIEGSIKGSGAVAEITPRLRALLRP